VGAAAARQQQPLKALLIFTTASRFYASQQQNNKHTCWAAGLGPSGHPLMMSQVHGVEVPFLKFFKPPSSSGPSWCKPYPSGYTMKNQFSVLSIPQNSPVHPGQLQA
jgi:hypothetical protein